MRRTFLLHSLPALAVWLAVIVSASSVSAQLPTPGPDSPWLIAPEFFPKGALIDFEMGDPHRKMPVRIVLAFRDNWSMPAHLLDQDIHLEVRQGSLLVGLGDKMSRKHVRALVAGDTLTIPGGTHHFLYSAADPTFVAISCMGPIRITYVRPDEDPSRRLPFGQ